MRPSSMVGLEINDSVSNELQILQKANIARIKPSLPPIRPLSSSVIPVIVPGGPPEHPMRATMLAQAAQPNSSSPIDTPSASPFLTRSSRSTNNNATTEAISTQERTHLSPSTKQSISAVNPDSTSSNRKPQNSQQQQQQQQEAMKIQKKRSMNAAAAQEAATATEERKLGFFGALFGGGGGSNGGKVLIRTKGCSTNKNRSKTRIAQSRETAERKEHTSGWLG
ncbi:hypothetical protein BJ741DRAFT_99634 [Chytriomyces cf. hyalinus JEL632]|nr:hypothetical protein BJ741DRAFT_99634 [Chytriomyces cf. hyalinus JEL632]